MIDRMLKLVYGAGSLEEGACWMSALRYYEGGSWSDQPACVCPVIRALAIRLNDFCDDEQRQRLIAPADVLFAPMGTAQPQYEKARHNLLAPFALEMAMHGYEAEDAPAYEAVVAAADATACAARAAVEYLASYVSAYKDATAVAQLALGAHESAYETAGATAALDDILERWRDFILELCEIGKEDRGDIERVGDMSKLVHVPC